MNETNYIWLEKINELTHDYHYIAKPRGLEIREKIASQYTVKMPAYLNLIDRKVNLEFMFSEAAWIISGDNKVSTITKYMKRYKDFSDDGIFLNGAYGPKVVDQLPYIVKTLSEDIDSRQAVINIWREKPAKSKDIPCTLSMQFIVRDGELNMVVTMRSHDIVLGFTYDVFSFSMIAKSVQLLLKEISGIDVKLGNLTVTAGSMHIYSNHYEKSDKWYEGKREESEYIRIMVEKLEEAETYDDLILSLNNLAKLVNESKS